MNVPNENPKCSRCQKHFRLTCEDPVMGSGSLIAVFHSCGNQLAITHPMSAVRFFEEGPDGEFRPSENFSIGEPTESP